MDIIDVSQVWPPTVFTFIVTYVLPFKTDRVIEGGKRSYRGDSVAKKGQLEATGMRKPGEGM